MKMWILNTEHWVENENKSHPEKRRRSPAAVEKKNKRKESWSRC